MSVSPNRKSPGHLIAAALAGSTRTSPPAFPLSFEEFATITPLMIRSGAGALLWWLIRDTALAQSDSAALLSEHYRQQHLDARVHAYKTRTVLTHLNQAGIESVLIKGWSVARLYPEPGLRHYGDLDLCVAPNQYGAADDVLHRELGAGRHYVDLHKALGHLDNLSWTELFARSQVLDLDGTSVRVLSPEDHLRVLCVHWLGHGAWKPAGLCDIAVALESRGPEFDWERCLGPDPKRADWVACTIGLARQLLDAEVGDAPLNVRARKLPSWLAPAVLRKWDRCVGPNGNGMALPALLSQLQRPAQFFREVYARWDNPVHATVELSGNFNEWPRLPYQLAALLIRAPEVPRQLFLMISEQLNLIRRTEPATRSLISDF